MAQKKEKKGSKKKTRADMVKDLRGYKKELQSVRFRLSAKSQQKTAAHRTLRKNIARTKTDLAALAKGKKIADDSKMPSGALKMTGK